MFFFKTVAFFERNTSLGLKIKIWSYITSENTFLNAAGTFVF
jgi:hypothetical protein